MIPHDDDDDDGASCVWCVHDDALSVSNRLKVIITYYLLVNGYDLHQPGSNVDGKRWNIFSQLTDPFDCAHR